MHPCALPYALTARAAQMAYFSAFPAAPLAGVFLCLYDTAVVFVEAAQALVKYGVHVTERWRTARAEQVGLGLSGRAHSS